MEKGTSPRPRSRNMRLTPGEYSRMVGRASPKSPLRRDVVWAFLVGGGICLLGEWLRKAFLAAGHTLGDAAALTSITLIGLSALCTALGWYQKLAAKAGAGTLVPITGFANAVVSQAIEFKVEGLVTGVGAKMFVIAGPVIVYGTMASWAWGLLYAALRSWG